MAGNNPGRRGREIAQYFTAERARVDSLYTKMDEIRNYLETEIRPIIEGLDSRFQEVEGKIDRATEDLRGEIEDVRSEAAAANQQAEQASDAVTALGATVTALGATVESLNQRYTELNEKYAALDADMEELHRGTAGGPGNAPQA